VADGTSVGVADGTSVGVGVASGVGGGGTVGFELPHAPTTVATRRIDSQTDPRALFIVNSCGE
jgi:hypothetical protein